MKPTQIRENRSQKAPEYSYRAADHNAALEKRRLSVNLVESVPASQFAKPSSVHLESAGHSPIFRSLGTSSDRAVTAGETVSRNSRKIPSASNQQLLRNPVLTQATSLSFEKPPSHSSRSNRN